MSINNLNAGTIATSDQVPFFSVSNGQDRKATVSELLNLAAATATGTETQYASPNATGFTVTVSPSQTGNSMWVLMTPLAGYAAGTVVYPAVATCVHGQELLITSTQAVTTLTTNGNGATVNGAPTTMAANSFHRLKFDGVNKSWYRIG